MLRKVLCELRIPHNVAAKYCSHDFRRGCAKDILQQSGPGPMMEHCGWKTSSAAMHYVTRDEIDQSVLAFVLADASDEDS